MRPTIICHMLPWLLAKLGQRFSPALKKETTLLLEKKSLLRVDELADKNRAPAFSGHVEQPARFVVGDAVEHVLLA